MFADEYDEKRERGEGGGCGGGGEECEDILSGLPCGSGNGQDEGRVLQSFCR